MKISELLLEKSGQYCEGCPYKNRNLELDEKIAAPTASQCGVKKLSNVRYAQCVSLGLKAHQSDHTDGTGKQGVKGSGHKLRGRKAKSVRHGGAVKDFSGPTRK